MLIIDVKLMPRVPRGAATIAVLAVAGLVAGCSTDRIFGSSDSGAAASASSPSSSTASSMGSMANVILPRRIENPTATDPAAETAKFAVENCPPVQIRPGASTLTVPPGNTDAFSLRYQGTIADLARECSLAGGIMRIKVGVQGRMVAGPAGGSGGQIDVPLRYAVVKEGAEPKTVVSKLNRIAVAVPAGQTNVPFTHVDSDVAFPMPPDRDLDAYIVYVGFDPIAEKQPAKKPASRSRR